MRFRYEGPEVHALSELDKKCPWCGRPIDAESNYEEVDHDPWHPGCLRDCLAEHERELRKDGAL